MVTYGSSFPDVTLEELEELAKEHGGDTSDLSIALAMYLLGFSTYKGFN